MKTKIKQVDGLETTLSYQTPVVVGGEIQVTGNGLLPIKFKLDSAINTAVTIKVGTDAAVVLKDTDGVAITALDKGLHEVVYDSGFFTLVSKGSGEKNFLMKYDGVSDTIVDLKGNPINVSVGDYVYNEFNSTSLRGVENIVNIDRTTPVQVVNAAYDTSGNGGRKLVRLDNGWLVAAVRNASEHIYFYVSKDNGATFSQLCWYSNDTDSYSVAVSGTNLFFIRANASAVQFFKIDCLTQTNVGISLTPFATVDSGQTICDYISLAIDSNGHLHAAWSSKNATYPNSFNIRYSKSTDGGATWASPTQLTTSNTTGADYANPTITIKNDNNPIIICSYSNSTQKRILSMSFAGTWTNVFVYIGDNYAQSNPSAIVDSSGAIHVVWHGTDSTDTTYANTRYSKSTDGGATWAAMQKLTTGNTQLRVHPSIATDLNSFVHILCTDTNNGGIYYIHNTSGSFSAPTLISSGVALYPSVLNNYNNFEKPITIWRSSTTSDVKFYGKWTENLTPVQVIPPMSLATAKTELQALYANTLKMHNPKTDARYQGFVSKKDLWTSELQELDWLAASISKSKNLFGLQGASPDKLYATGSFSWSTTSTPSTHTQNITGLAFEPKLMVVLPYGESQQNLYGNHAVYTKGIVGSENTAHNGETGNGGQPYPSISAVTASGFTVSILGSSGYALNGTARWFAIG